MPRPQHVPTVKEGLDEFYEEQEALIQELVDFEEHEGAMSSDEWREYEEMLWQEDEEQRQLERKLVQEEYSEILYRGLLHLDRRRYH